MENKYSGIIKNALNKYMYNEIEIKCWKYMYYNKEFINSSKRCRIEYICFDSNTHEEWKTMIQMDFSLTVSVINGK